MSRAWRGAPGRFSDTTGFRAPATLDSPGTSKKPDSRGWFQAMGGVALERLLAVLGDPLLGLARGRDVFGAGRERLFSGNRRLSASIWRRMERVIGVSPAMVLILASGILRRAPPESR